MRKLCESRDAELAQNFASFLATEKISAELQQDDGEHTIWIHDEDALARAEQYWREYQQHPEDPKFKRRASVFSVSSPKNDNPAKIKDRSRYVDVRSEIFSRGGGTGVVTISLIVICILATFVLDLPAYQWLKVKFYYSEYMSSNFYEIKSGQLWRLVTPIFLHGGFLHLFFNMLWIKDLGGQMEALEKGPYLALFVIVTAVIVNTAQYIMSGPAFVGASGVLYAMLGYTWMMSKFSSRFAYALAPGTVMMMLIWMAICVVGIIPNVANTQHVVGFAIGVVWGYLRSGEPKLWLRRKLRRRSLR